MVFWTAINLFTFHKNPKWVPYPGNFRSWYTGFGAQWKRRQKIEQCFGEIYWQLDILNVYLWVKYSMAKEKDGDFMKNIQQLPKPWCTFLLNMWQVTVQNNCGPVYTWFRIIDFNLKYVLGKNELSIKNKFIFSDKHFPNYVSFYFPVNDF